MSKKIYGIPVTTPFNPEKLGAGGSGAPGKDGFSPIANVTQTDTGAVISITDKSGTTTATIVNGKDGVDGKDGMNGLNGMNGKDGKTPVKGEDYFTEAEIQEIAEYVAEMVEVPEGSGSGVYILADGETVEDAPADADVVIDPNGEGVRAVMSVNGVKPDESGNVVVAGGGAGGGSGADWSQNDPSAPDYIKNKPFYTEVDDDGNEIVHKIDAKYMPEGSGSSSAQQDVDLVLDYNTDEPAIVSGSLDAVVQKILARQKPSITIYKEYPNLPSNCMLFEVTNVTCVDMGDQYALYIHFMYPYNPSYMPEPRLFVFLTVDGFQGTETESPIPQ